VTDLTCRTFIERLDDLLEGRLSPAEHRAAGEHLDSCGACRDLKSLVAEAGAPVAPPADLLAAVLARTSGPACGSARARLCDHLDRLLASVDDEMVRMHLDGCVECGGLAAALARLATDLPPLAAREPDAGFVADVLARTSRRATLPARFTARLAAGWRRLAHRPRIAWEGAYAGSIMLVLLFGTPNAPFADVPGKALDVVRTVQESLPAAAVRAEIPRFRPPLRSRWEETRSGIRDATRDLTTALMRRSTATWGGLKKDLGTAWSRIASEETTHADDGNEGER
jgi:hypothetical protein